MRKKKKNAKLQIALIIIITALVSSGITSAVFLIIMNNKNSSGNDAMQPTTLVLTSPVDGSSDSTAASNPSNPSVEQDSQEQTSQNQDPSNQDAGNASVPEELAEIAAKSGSDVSQFDFDQLITVNSNGTTATVSFYEKQNNSWVKSAIESEEGFVGNMGVSTEANESSSYTPKGLYSLGTAFGIMPNPGTSMDYFTVTEDDYWVDDPNSQYYNQHVKGTENSDWSSAEHLIESRPNYNYAVFIEYNTQPVVAGKGSAFFMHVGNMATSGCVAVSEGKMVETLKWLNKEKSPHILIV